MLKPSYLVI
jgi:integration host factor subunit beta